MREELLPDTHAVGPSLFPSDYGKHQGSVPTLNLTGRNGLAGRGQGSMLENGREQRRSRAGIRSASSSSTFFSGHSMSPKLEFEAAEFEQHLEHRGDRLARMQAKREASKRRAIERQEFYWKHRNRTERSTALAKKLSAEALAQPITFLPQLPEAVQMARNSWAKDDVEACEAKRLGGTETLEETRRLVHDLSDDLGTLSTVISAWAKPDMKGNFARTLKSRAMDSKGMAPQSRHFRAISVMPDQKAEAFAPEAVLKAQWH